jgi:ferredoxin--NADP+ reductase
MTVSVAIIGSGPAGFYTAEALCRREFDVSVDIIERLPTPFGLIRAGVAPDHQTTKKVSRVFEKTAQRDEVRYFGNVEVGTDVSLDELRGIYDAVVLAVGAPGDQPLGIPGEDKRGVYGSATFVGWYNGHPDFRDLDPDLEVKAAAVIGVGNVAIDVARVLVKTDAEMAESDIPSAVADAIRASPLTDVYIFGRRGPNDAKFTNVELREMGELETAVSLVDAAQLPDKVPDLPPREQRLKAKNLATLSEFSERTADEKPKHVHFRFFASPVEILGGDRVEGLRLEQTRVEDGRAKGTGEFFDIDCGLVIPAVGYRADPVDGAPFDDRRRIVPNDGGRVADGLYAVGWIKRGPTGVISTNRPDGVEVAEHIETDIGEGGNPGRQALRDLLKARGVGDITYPDWQKIDAAEVANATPPAPRQKFVTVEEMLAVLDGN